MSDNYENVTTINSNIEIQIEEEEELPVSEEVVELLEVFLKSAKDGALVEFVGVVRYCDQNVDGCRAGDPDQPDLMQGRLFSCLQSYSTLSSLAMEDEDFEEEE